MPTISAAATAGLLVALMVMSTGDSYSNEVPAMAETTDHFGPPGAGQRQDVRRDHRIPNLGRSPSKI